MLSCLLNTNTQAQEGCDLLCQLGKTNPAVPSKESKENKPQTISPRSQNTEAFSSINRGNLFSEKDLYALINFLVNTATEGEASLDELQENLKFSFDNFKVQRDAILISNFRVLGRDRFSDRWINIVNIPSINCTGYRISDKSIYLPYMTPPYQTMKKLYDNFLNSNIIYNDTSVRCSLNYPKIWVIISKFILQDKYFTLAYLEDLCLYYDTLTTMVYDTTFIYTTITDTNLISVTDTLVINVVLTGIPAPNNTNTINTNTNTNSTNNENDSNGSAEDSDESDDDNESVGCNTLLRTL